LTKKDFIHKSEIPTILSGVIDGHKVAMNDATGLWKGAMDDTTVDNFIVNRGGWNCGHELIPVSEVVVPKEVRDRHENSYISNSNEGKNEKFERFSGKVVDITKQDAISKLSELSKTEDYEHSYCFLSDGSVYFKEHTKERKGVISFTSEERKKFEGADLYHNHPKDSFQQTLSEQDIAFMITNKLNSISMVYGGYIKTMQVEKGKTYDINEFNRIYHEKESEVQEKAYNSIGKPTDYYNYINTGIWDDINKEIQEELGIIYTIERRK
jgi:hypothetical protein